MTEPKTEQECREVLKTMASGNIAKDEGELKTIVDCAPPPTTPYPYTEQQIEDFCEKWGKPLTGSMAEPGDWYRAALHAAVQIIRQLQGQG